MHQKAAYQISFLPWTCKTQTSHLLEKYRCDWLAPRVTSHHADSRQCGRWGDGAEEEEEEEE